MEREKIIQDIKHRKGTDIPSLQREYGISYAEAKSIVDEMVKNSDLAYMGGISYKFVGQLSFKEIVPLGDDEESPFDDEDDDDLDLDDLFDDDEDEDETPVFKANEVKRGNDVISENELKFRAVRLCILKGTASVSLLQRSLPIGYLKACKLIDWMEEQGYITPAAGSRPRKVLITDKEYDLIAPAMFDDEDDEDDEDPLEGWDEKEREIREIIERQKSKFNTALTRLADVLNKIAVKKDEEELADGLPEHPSWDNEFEFIWCVRKNIETVIKSDKKLGLVGAIKKARSIHWELNDLGDKRMGEVFARVVYEFECMSPYQYSKRKKKYFN